MWVETKGRTLEQIDELFDDEKHSDVPDAEDIIAAPTTLRSGPSSKAGGRSWWKALSTFGGDDSESEGLTWNQLKRRTR